MSWYISGPMSHQPQFNFPLFDEVRDDLLRLGMEVISPADHDRSVSASRGGPRPEDCDGYEEGDLKRYHVASGMTFDELLGWDLRQIASPECKGVILLPGWENSTGAQHERYVAEACGKAVLIAWKDARYDIWTYKPDDDRTLSAKREFARGIFGSLQPTPTPVSDLGVDLCGTPYRTAAIITARDRGEPQVIGLTGYAQVGKDTLAAILVRDHGFTRVAFADVLRQCAYALNPYVCIDPPSHQGKPFAFRRLQYLVDFFGWEKAKTYADVRETLQKLGTEVGRNILGGDIWVDTAMKLVKPGGKYVFTDVRFPNEFDAIRDRGGQIIRITRPGYAPVNAHASETAVDHLKADVDLSNDGTVEDLAAQLVERWTL